jgi:hypothetical protein
MIRINKKITFQLLLCIGSAVISFAQTFSNNSGQAHNTWDAASTTWGVGIPLSKSISVSGMPLSLGGSLVLRQINIRLGNGSNTGLNLSTYKMRLYHPDGTTFIDICSSGGNDCGGSSIGDVNIKYRDDATLRSVGQLASGTPSAAWPYHIGYYRVVNSGSFSAFNGLNPNGNWELRILEGTASEIAFRGVDLVFGTPLEVVDISTSVVNDVCSAAQCIDNAHVYRATNNGYLNPGPASDPAITVGTCSWNGAKNNTAWFYFVASGATASVTISGLSAMQQSIGLSMAGSCTAPIYSVPNGGCPNAAVNNQYLGGASHGSSGMSYNHELNFSGLTAGNTYYVVVDGTGGLISPFYIELNGNANPCTVILGLDILNFTTQKQGNSVHLKWETTISQDFLSFEVERSSDGISFEKIGSLTESDYKNQNSMLFSFTDFDPLTGDIYYRLRYLGQNGATQLSEIKVLNFDKTVNFYIQPNPSEDFISIANVAENTGYKICNLLGETVLSGTYIDGKIETASLSSGVYILMLEGFSAKRFNKK